ncbi:ArnT family glycosyltransferase [Marinobacterium aestuariivivens]|uniref:ArnT family glycosyltransferase n=1 Tax=Marinobacterium aestuariivivens TaxID=1698799 RepID=A0ABW1ZVJ1_9GAMM
MDSVGDHKKIAPGPNLYSNLKARNQSLFAVSIVFILSAVVRIVFFSGFFGSDDFTYYSAAYGIVEKKMEVGNYIGGIRYGVNLPMAFFIGIFGSSEFIGNLWSLITSSLEVALVYYMARSWWGERAGISAALLLMLMPIHVHYGGRIMADAPLALFISLSFCLFWFAKEKRKSILYFLSGCVLGWVFWIKATVAVLVHLAFIPNLLMLIKQEGMKKVWIVAVGSMLVVGLNFLFFWVFKGDPFHLIKSIHAATSKYSHVSFESHPLYYAEYLF